MKWQIKYPKFIVTVNVFPLRKHSNASVELLSQLQQGIFKKTKHENLYAPYLLLGVLQADNLKG